MEIICPLVIPVSWRLEVIGDIPADADGENKSCANPEWAVKVRFVLDKMLQEVDVG